jgi:Domain of unknown function (DUF6916)
VLEDLTADTFAPAVGHTFRLDAGEAGGLDLELVESRLHDPDAPERDDSGKRAPFSLLFKGPAQPILEQRIYSLEHESIGALEIFIVPVAHDEAGTSYEAVFA